jgi:hypothetical protein
MLVDVADRITAIQEVIDKVWNTADTCWVSPILQDAQDEVAEVCFDMTEWKDNKLTVIGERGRRKSPHYSGTSEQQE